MDDVIVRWDDSTLCLTLVADEYPAVELWDTERKAVPLLADVFDRRIELESTAAEPPANGRE